MMRSRRTPIGHENTVVGTGAGPDVVTGSGNIYIGVRAGMGVGDEFGFIRIGEPSPPFAYDCYIQGIYGRVGGPAPLAVVCGSDGKLSANASSRRFKHDIKRMDKTSEAILALKPVTFVYNDDPTNLPWFGLIAEEVGKVNEELIVRDKEGKPFGVRYDAVNAMLLNEFLKEHQKVQKLETALAAVNERLKEQDAKIDKVNAKVELTAPARQVTNNSQ
jgi:hypothetical protein